MTATARILRIALLRLRARTPAVRLLSTITLDMSRARLAKSTAVGALRDRTTLFRDVLQLSVTMIAIANAMATNTRLASPFFSVNQHSQLRIGGRL